MKKRQFLQYRIRGNLTPTSHDTQKNQIQVNYRPKYERQSNIASRSYYKTISL